MNTAPIATFKPFQQLYPLNLLAQVTSRKTSGCLRIFNGSTSWSIYLEQGELIYASSSTEPFERLDRHLRQLSRHIPTLVSAVRVQVRLLFEHMQQDQFNLGPDYRAICWLIQQQHLNHEQAANLILQMAKEVIESLLLVQEGSYEILDKDRFDDWGILCQIDLRAIVEHCQNQLQQNQTSGRSSPAPTTPPKPVAEPDSGRSPQLTQPPVSNPARSNAIAPGSTTARSKRDGLPKGKYTIVCIDDSSAVLQAIKSFLDDVSFTVIMVNDPVKALMQVIRNKPDLILLDVGMPNLDGYELCSLLRKHQHFKHTPIIMVTGHTGFIDRAKAKLVGASGYLTKPFTQSDLLKIVFKHLK